MLKTVGVGLRLTFGFKPAMRCVELWSYTTLNSRSYCAFVT
jgi:hypothetical protein